MKICLTGASSFTGNWIAHALAASGHHVVANFSASEDAYGELRRRRISALKNTVDCRFAVPYGTNQFEALVKAERPAVLALHGAEVTNYRSWDFDPLEAAKLNTAGARALFEQLGAYGGVVIATGSVFEPFEGVGDAECRSFNPYGLSKHLSYEVFRMEAARASVPLSKFVIPNPFGPLEEPRFTHYLVSEWSAGRIPSVGTPEYVRDNIHVDLLAESYAGLVSRVASGPAARLRPSGYIESQGQFARRFAAELGRRVGRDLHVAMAVQSDFPEPRIRVNDEPAAALVPSWSEAAAWDSISNYYAERLSAAR